MDRSFKQKAIGTIGEKIIANKCTSNGKKVMWNVQEFGYWDLEIEDLKCQVKTLTPFVKHNSWCISESKTGKNIENILKCDYLYIVSIPTIKPHKTDGKIIKIDTSKLSRKDVILLEGSETPSLVINRDAMYISEEYTLDQQEVAAITEHKISYFNKKS